MNSTPPPKYKKLLLFIGKLYRVSKSVSQSLIGIKVFFEKIDPKILSNHNHPKSPLNPWAFIRVCNEAQTLEQSLNSILGAIKRGIIVYNECSDGSDQIIQNFCKKHPSFICAEYPYQVLRCQHNKDERKYKKKLCDYYNFALSFIPKDEWLIKIDADQIYDTQKLKESFKLIQKTRDVLIYGQLNLHIFGNHIYLPKKGAFKQAGDCWLIRNYRLKFTEFIVRKNKHSIYSYEILNIGFSNQKIYPPLDTWHFPLLKESRKNLAKLEDYIPIQSYDTILKEEILQNKITLDMLDEQKILTHLKTSQL